MHSPLYKDRLGLWGGLLFWVVLYLGPALAMERGSDTPFVTSISLGGTWHARCNVLTPAQATSPMGDESALQEITVPSNWFQQGRDVAGIVWFRRRFPVLPHRQGQLVRLVFTDDYRTSLLALSGLLVHTPFLPKE